MAKTDARYGKCQFSKICFHDKTNKAIQEDGATQSLLAELPSVCVSVQDSCCKKREKRFEAFLCCLCLCVQSVYQYCRYNIGIVNIIDGVFIVTDYQD